MVSWYYVEGTERVGPVSFEALETLYKDEKIGFDTYVWKKGFANWERLKNVNELTHLQNKDYVKSEVVVEETSEEAEDGLIDISLDENDVGLTVEANYQNDTVAEVEPISWLKINKNESKFFILIGNDRIKTPKEVFGPYSVTELLEAYHQKRINGKTLVFTQGFDSWQALAAIPYFKDELGFSALTLPIDSRKPLYFVALASGNRETLLVKAISNKYAKVLSAHAFLMNENILVSLFEGAELIEQNIAIDFENILEKEQAFSIKLKNLNTISLQKIKEFNE